MHTLRDGKERLNVQSLHQAYVTADGNYPTRVTFYACTGFTRKHHSGKGERARGESGGKGGVERGMNRIAQKELSHIQDTWNRFVPSSYC